MTAATIAVYGATGHTGRLVAAELAARDNDIVLAGRDAGALHALADELGTSARVRVAALDDPAALRTVTEDVAVVINCAGPFSRSGDPVASAALATGCHYLDHAAEPLHVKHLFDTFQARAHEAGTVMVPGVSFYGALADLLADLVTTDMPHVDMVTVAYAVSGWRMTTASKTTAAQLNGTDRVLYINGTYQVAPAGTGRASFAFPPPIGTRTVLVDYPAGEVVTIPRHVPAQSVRALMTADTFTEDAVFTSENLDPAARAQSGFTSSCTRPRQPVPALATCAATTSTEQAPSPPPRRPTTSPTATAGPAWVFSAPQKPSRPIASYALSNNAAYSR